MNDIQNSCFNLLLEIREICIKYNIVYFLDPETAAKSLLYKGFKNNNDTSLSLLMDIENGLKFIEKFNMENRYNREIEYMGNSGHYPSFSISYVNKDSTYIEISDGTNYEKKGVRININFIRNSNKNLFFSLLEKGWETNDYNYSGLKDIKTLISFLYVRFMMIFGRKRVSRYIFNTLCKFYIKKNNSNQVFIRKFKGNRKSYSANIFLQSKEICFEGKNFPVPLMINTYVTKFLGKKWNKKMGGSYNKKKSNIIYLKNIPYEYYLKCLQENIPYNKTVIIRKINLILRWFIRNDLEYKEKAWIIAKRSGDRLNIYEDLMQKKDKIDFYYNKRNYKALDKILSEYKKKAKYYLKYNLSLCPNEYFLNILCECLDNRGDYKTAEKLLKYMPQKHKKPLIESEKKHI